MRLKRAGGSARVIYAGLRDKTVLPNVRSKTLSQEGHAALGYRRKRLRRLQVALEVCFVEAEAL